MELLKQRIQKDGCVIGDDIVKVDSFLNHQVDVGLLNEIGKEFHTLFANENINKIMTVESSGIGIACITAQYFSVPVVFAKKGNPRNIGSNLYTSDIFSFTKNETYKISISCDFLNKEDRILIIDDFLANGNAALGLMNIIGQAGATLGGVGIVIEKGFQSGGRLLREKGVRLESLAIVKSIKNGDVVFAD